MGDNPSPASLTPSQALNANAASFNPNGNSGNNGNNNSNANNNNNKNKRRNNRRRNNRKPNNNATANSQEKQEGENNASSNASTGQAQAQGQGKRRQRGKQGNQSNANTESSSNAPQEGNQQNKQAKQGKAKNNRNRKNNRKGQKKYPWRKFIPKDTMDPITLENLISLEYPPFALVATEPYTPVPVWPLATQSIGNSSEGQTTGSAAKTESVEEVNRKRLQEQWGSSVLPSEARGGEQGKEEGMPLEKRHLHLYDGRALAYYLVSQLQFIDPLNRRDLTRPELLNLDAYLKRHGFNDMSVTEAYDAKGITLSSAGAAASTAEGRAEIMQQIATNLLNALFGGQSVSAPTTTTRAQPSALQEQYAALRRQEEDARQSQQTLPFASDNPFDSGIYGFEDGGVMVVDDDENPGLRGDGDHTAAMQAAQARHQYAAAQAQGQTQQSHPFYSARHIADRYGDGRSMNTTDAFPALPPAPAPSQASNNNKAGVSRNRNGIRSVSKPAPVFKTLSRITGAVKKTDPEEMQRQWEAREEARRKAILSNLSFGTNATAAAMQDLPQPPPTAGQAPVTGTEAQLSRNRAFAEALGVKPATVRNQFSSGWARPTDTRLSIDEFGNELNAALYPDSLILEARERMPLVLKVEKKWKAFLADDSAASLPLNAMDRPARKFVHHYSDFWKLRTESFDPEPKRYIHCVKMVDTVMPHPLLSHAVRNWRGPTMQTITTQSDHAVQQTAGQTSSEEVKSSLPPEGEAVAALDALQNSRFDALSSEPKERTKLDLAKRSVPLELAPFEPQKEYSLADDLKKSEERLKEKKQKAREAAKRHQKALAAAFASDSEDEREDSEDEWQETAPVFVGEEDE
ncbi:unnamed protein product [Cylindrotheca closterium]|uniref:R3H domain-containing protein n=1 Tax=Cylindrotheca closterium TaxID=2856 RepID=A0AAD2FJZ3_9STRA|nr:unnamed protein product [Cylindrotheca closterium]